jgi:hypothetical protein
VDVVCAGTVVGADPDGSVMGVQAAFVRRQEVRGNGVDLWRKVERRGIVVIVC